MKQVSGLAVLIASLVAALVLLPWLFQRRMIYLPSSGPPPPASATLADTEEVSLRTADGLRLGAWFARGGGRDAATFLVFNGNAGDRALRAGLAETLRSTGANVLLTDYRGYGGNPGSPTEDGLIADARAAREFVLTRPDVDPARLVYFGESLGSGVAVALAAEHPPAALVLRSPFSSLVDAGRVHFPWLPVDWLLRDRFPSDERIRGVRCPVLVIAGDRDSVVPIGLSRKLYEAAPGPRRWVAVPGADHNDAGLADGAAWREDLRGFLAEHGP